jgi:hypothetical protein
MHCFMQEDGYVRQTTVDRSMYVQIWKCTNGIALINYLQNLRNTVLVTKRVSRRKQETELFHLKRLAVAKII